MSNTTYMSNSALNPHFHRYTHLTHTQTHIHTNTHSHTHTHFQTHTPTHTNTHTSTHTPTHIHTHTHTNTHTNTLTHTRKHTLINTHKTHTFLYDYIIPIKPTSSMYVTNTTLLKPTSSILKYLLKPLKNLHLCCIRRMP
jgi:hypothetical protein